MIDVLDVFLDLVNINSPSKSEHDVSQYCAKYLKQLGFHVVWDSADSLAGSNVGNLIATLPGTDDSKLRLLFAAHLDTVEPTPNLIVQIQGDIISASSDTILGADDKCGAAPILAAMKQLCLQKLPHGQIQILFSICEEIGLVGAAHLDQTMISSDFGFVLDGGPPLGSLVLAAPASECLEIIVRGKSAHAGAAPEEGINAIVAASRAIASLNVGRIDHETTTNIGVITGGQARNIVPDAVTVIAEARSRNQEKLRTQIGLIKNAFTVESSKMGASVSIRTTNAYPAYCLDKDAPVIALAAVAAESVRLTASYRESGGGTDANHLNGFGIPTAVLSTGMEKIHTHDEFCRISDLGKNRDWVLAIIAEATKLPS